MEHARATLGRARHNAYAAAPKANAQVGINGDSSRTMAFGAGEAFCKAIASPGSPLSSRFHFTAAAQPPLHRLSSHLATEENGTTLPPRRSQPNRAAQPKQPGANHHRRPRLTRRGRIAALAANRPNRSLNWGWVCEARDGWNWTGNMANSADSDHIALASTFAFLGITWYRVL